MNTGSPSGWREAANAEPPESESELAVSPDKRMIKNHLNTLGYVPRFALPLLSLSCTPP